jgi:negative regulator of sigma E activity
MNNLSQNELLSAYLDGELNAAETAEVERLLATNPAARRLLDELRSLGSMLQSLPQQKLGMDLSADVLRIAERRMKNEEIADAAKPSPATDEPALPFDYRRFVNRRTMLWTGLAVAVAVMISINERNQQKPAANREVATTAAARSDAKPDSARADLTKDENEFTEPPSIRAVPAAPIELTAKSSAKACAKPEALSEAESPGLKQGEKRLASKSPGEDGKDFDGVAGKWTQSGGTYFGDVAGNGGQLGRTPSLLDAPAHEAKSDLVAKATPPPSDLNVRDKAGAPMPRKGASLKSKAGLETGQPLNRPAPDVLVVYCDISPDAVVKKSFDKLLDANGIVSRRKPLRESVMERVDRFQSQSDAKQSAKSRQDGEQNAESLEETAASDKAELVYVEATPAQIRATLAGLEAQPNVFVSFSVRPAVDKLSRQYVDRYQSEREHREGRSTGSSMGQGGQRWLKNSTGADDSPAFGMPKASVPAVAKKDAKATRDNDSVPHDTAQKDNSVAQTPSPAAIPPASQALGQLGDTLPNDVAVPQAAPNTAPNAAPNAATGEEKSQEVQRRGGLSQQKSLEFYGYGQSAAPVQRVLFVLRVTGGTGTAAAARVMDKAKVEASKAAGEPAPAPPAANPTPSK